MKTRAHWVHKQMNRKGLTSRQNLMKYWRVRIEKILNASGGMKQVTYKGSGIEMPSHFLLRVLEAGRQWSNASTIVREIILNGFPFHLN